MHQESQNFFPLSLFLPSLPSPTHLPDFFFQENWTPVGQVHSLKVHNLKPRKTLFSNSPVSDPIEVLSCLRPLGQVGRQSTITGWAWIVCLAGRWGQVIVSPTRTTCSGNFQTGKGMTGRQKQDIYYYYCPRVTNKEQTQRSYKPSWDLIGDKQQSQVYMSPALKDFFIHNQ